MNFRFRYISLFILLCYTFSSAEVRYVSKTGSSTPPYTSWETAADSIQKCINISFNGDTIVVANGVYKEFLVIDSSLTLIGSSMDSCVIDGTGIGDRLTIEANNNLRIIGFKIIGKGIETVNTIIYIRYDKLLDISSCKLSTAGSGISMGTGNIKDVIISNIFYRGIKTFCPDDTCRPLMENCVVLITGGAPYSTAWSDNFGGNPTLIGNILISFNADKGISSSNIGKQIVKNNLVAGFRYSNINSGGREGAVIVNNISRDYRQGGVTPQASMLYVNSRDTLENNIIINNQVGVSFNSKPVKSDYNLYYNNIADVNNAIGLGEHDVFADPMFLKDTLANSLNYDYHLQKFSPAIDAGDPDILDLDGSRSDIGMYGGVLGITYTYQDLPPRPPKDFIVNLDSINKQLSLKWTKYSEADFSHYNIHKSDVQGFTPDSSNRIAQTDTSFFIDSIEVINKGYYYRIIAVDSAGYQSIPGPEISIVILEANDPVIRITDEYQLYQNYPNPFNPSTVIPFSLKERGKVRIVVYDIKGEMIRELVNREEEKGYHEVHFTAEGLKLSSGIYLYRIEVTGQGRIPQYMAMKKMIYLK